MNDVVEKQAVAVGTVVPHPSRAAGKKKILSQRFSAKRSEAIASLEHVIECLQHLAHRQTFDLAEEHIRECRRIILELEALDPSMPRSADEIGTLFERLGRLFQELNRRSSDSQRHKLAATNASP